MTWTAPEVTRRTGATDAAEREMLEGFLNFQRDTFALKIQGLTGEQLATRPFASSSMSLLGLIRHLAKVERTWFRQRFDGQNLDPLYDPALGKDADFDAIDAASAADDHASLAEQQRLADETAATGSLDDTFTLDGQVYSLRLVYNHLIAEYARHNGHADLIREHIDGVTGA